MNCLLPEDVKAQNLRNKRLERNLQMYKRKYYRQIKLLMMGTSGSGKSTFLRQMYSIYPNGHDHRERMNYVRIIYKNTLNAMQTMIEAMQIMGIPYETKENAIVNSALVKYVDSNHPQIYNEVLLAALKDLWADAGIQKCYMHRREYDLLDSTKYFFDNLDRLAAPYYIPSETDILRARVPPKALQDHYLTYRNVEFLITDVGLQGSEPKKWMHFFDNATAIIFMVAISEYDQFSMDSDHRNRLKESQDLLKTIVSYNCFKDISIILVFSKCDIFEEKIMDSPLDDYYPGYTGPDRDPKAARSYILKMFLDIIPSERRTYYYFINSIDLNSNSLEFVYSAIRDTILNLNLYNFNLV